MSMEKFIESLSDEQRESLKKILGDKDGDDTGSPRVDDEFKVQNREVSENKRRTEVKGKKNQWVDTGEDQDITTPDIERTPRRRSAPKKETVECHVCGKTFKADLRYVYGEYYRCNKCTGR